MASSPPRPANREYQGDGIVVTWESARCQRATECVRGLPAVFDRNRRPWIVASAADVDQPVTVIDGATAGSFARRAAPPRGERPGPAVEYVLIPPSVASSV